MKKIVLMLVTVASVFALVSLATAEEKAVKTWVEHVALFGAVTKTVTYNSDLQLVCFYNSWTVAGGSRSVGSAQCWTPNNTPPSLHKMVKPVMDKY